MPINNYGNTDRQVFKGGIQTLKDFLAKNCIPKGNYLILQIGVVNSMSKIIRIFLGVFSLENTNLGAHFFFLIFFEIINF